MRAYVKQQEGVENAQVSVEDDLRRGLEDTLVIVTKLAPLASNLEHLIDLLKLSLENDAQFTLFVNLLSLGKK